MIPEKFDPVFQDTVYTSRITDTSISVNLPSALNNQKTADSALAVQIATTRKPVKNAEVEIKPAVTKTKESTPLKWNTSENFFRQNGLNGIVSGIEKQTIPSQSATVKPDTIDVHPREKYTYDWLLGIFLFLVILFTWIKVFYNKFFTSLGSALSSFQLSLKMFQERNMLHQRVSIVLDFIYIVVFSIFLFEYIEYSGQSGPKISGIRLFLMLLNIIMLYTLLRVMILRITGSLFMVRPLFAEYIHNTFVVNKALGIALFPIIIMLHYMPYKVIPVILVIGTAVFVVAFLLKSFRAYQIIIRRDILIFYLILYLCTLEILPLLLGYKFVTSLIQSN